MPIRRSEEPEEPVLSPVMPDRAVNPSLLCPGRVVYRYTEPSGSALVAETPCHETQWVRLPLREGVDRVAACRLCSAMYTVALRADGDGGFYAVFVVAEDDALLSRGRR